MQKTGESQIAGAPSLEDTTRTAAHCQQSCHWCHPDTLLMRVTSASTGQETHGLGSSLPSFPTTIDTATDVHLWKLLGGQDENVSFVFPSLWGSQGA